MRKLKLLALLTIAAALAAGCTSAATPASAPATAASAKAATINATLTDMKIAVDRNSISSGPVTFVVKNSGAVVHELVVLKTTVAEGKLAAGTEAGKMDETGNLGETGDMAASGSKTFTATLPAGQYTLICNEAGHYASGMHLAFTVN